MKGITRMFFGLESPAMMLLFLACAVLVMSPVDSATGYMIAMVGGNMGWTTNFNYSTWAKNKHLYNGDLIYFVYDRHRMNVLEVNKTDYETCNYDHPIHNWSNGTGRDVVPPNVSRSYYFISGKGFSCHRGVKIAIHVENRPTPPGTSCCPKKRRWRSSKSATLSSLRVDSSLSVIGTAWDGFIHYFKW